MVISEQFIKEIDGLIADKLLVLRVGKRVPGFSRETGENFIVLRVQFDFVPVEVLKKAIGSKNLGNLHQLVGIAAAVEKGLLSENHRGKHGT